MFRITIIGNLGRDAEVFDANQKSFLSLNVAADYRGKDGKELEWVTVTTNNRGKLVNYLKRGTKIYATGSATIREFTDKEGKQHKTIGVFADDIQLLGGNTAASDDAFAPIQ